SPVALGACGVGGGCPVAAPPFPGRLSSPVWPLQPKPLHSPTTENPLTHQAASSTVYSRRFDESAATMKHDELETLASKLSGDFRSIEPHLRDLDKHLTLRTYL